MISRLLCLSALVCGVLACSAFATPLVVTSVKPLGLIANDIAGGLARVEVLLPSNASPHDYALRPSDLTKIKQADVVLWVGPEMETFLTKILTEQKNTLTLTTYPEMPLLQYDTSLPAFGGEGHRHQGVDGHLWLGPAQSKLIAQAVATKLAELDPLNAATYNRNYQTFVEQVTATEQQISAKLAPFKHKKYVLFHDGYGYFEQAFALRSLGYFTVSPERKPGAKTMFIIRSMLQKNKAQCVFSEPQFNPGLVYAAAKGSRAKVVMLDPMAKDLALTKHRYVDFLRELGQSFVTCFKQ